MVRPFLCDRAGGRGENSPCRLLLSGMIVSATEMSGDFWPRNSGAKETSRMLWLQPTFRSASVHCREPPSAAPRKTWAVASLLLSTVLAFPQSCAPHRAPRTGVIFQEASLQRSPSQKYGDCNLMVPETEAIGNSVSVPDFAREVILIPHNTSIPLCFLFYIFFLLIVGPCEACGYNKKTEAGMPLN